jgi:hypothetical protein
MSADIVHRTAYDHLFNSGLTLSKIKDAALGGTLFHLDETDDITSTGVPGRSLAWKVQRFALLPPHPTPTDTSIRRFFSLRLILSTLSLNFHPIRRYTDAV